MKFLALTAIALSAVIVKAQDACIVDCAYQVCPDGLTDLNCFCVTGTDAILACLSANCTAADLTTGTALGESVCSNLLRPD